MADTKGTGWVTYSGILLILGGVIALFDAIWAFRYSDTVVDLILFENNLEVWGVIWLIVGAVVIAAGFGVFNAKPWARVVGIVAASLSIVSNLNWAQIQPTQALIAAILAALVIYGLAVHGDADIT
jgi:uncharacterized membrane protein HdeD (DUF308 family)